MTIFSFCSNLSQFTVRLMLALYNCISCCLELGRNASLTDELLDESPLVCKS